MSDYPGFFADAETNYKDAFFVLFSVPYDETSTFRKGSKKAPTEIRKASWNYEPYNMFTDVDLKDVKFHDYGDLQINSSKPGIVYKEIKDFTSKLLKDKKFPVMLGGEHSITAAAINSFPDDTTVLVLDAHLDFRDEYGGEKLNHACVNQRVLEHVGVENIVVLGVRSAERKEYNDAKKLGLYYVDAFEIKELGIEESLKKIKERINDKNIYLSIDMDVFDPCFAPGVGTPEPFGITSFDFLKIVDSFSNQLVGFDLVEVNPDFDHGEITSFLAAKNIRLLIESVWKHLD